MCSWNADQLGRLTPDCYRPQALPVTSKVFIRAWSLQPWREPTRTAVNAAKRKKAPKLNLAQRGLLQISSRRRSLGRLQKILPNRAGSLARETRLTMMPDPRESQQLLLMLMHAR